MGAIQKELRYGKYYQFFLIIFGVALLFSPLIETLNSVSDTKSSTVYSPKGQSGGTDLQDLYKKRQEWRKRSEDAYQKGGYWRYD